MRLKLI